MSLQDLNPDIQDELVEEKTQKANPMSGAFSKLRTNSIGTLLRGEYPASHRLEELLLDFE